MKLWGREGKGWSINNPTVYIGLFCDAWEGSDMAVKVEALS